MGSVTPKYYQFLFSQVPELVAIPFNFIVDSTNGNGLGIRSLKGSGIDAVYMHTSATPAPGNPNPAAGTILVQTSKTFNRFLAAFGGQGSPVGTPITLSAATATPGVAYIITSLGTTTTAANWTTFGLEAGVTPALGATVIAATSGTGLGNATVAPANASGITCVELVGDPSQTNSPSQGSMFLVFHTLAATNASTTTLIPTAPANGTVIGMTLLMRNSPLKQAGE